MSDGLSSWCGHHDLTGCWLAIHVKSILRLFGYHHIDKPIVAKPILDGEIVWPNAGSLAFRRIAAVRGARSSIQRRDASRTSFASPNSRSCLFRVIKLAFRDGLTGSSWSIGWRKAWTASSQT